MNEHALIIGGTKGTGRSLARMFSDRGCLVSVMGRTLEEPSDGMRYFQADLMKDDIGVDLERVVGEQGPVNYIVFCQRFRGEGDAWENELKVSLSATRSIIEYFAQKPGALAEGDRSFVVISSIASRMVVCPQPLGYHVAKAGLESMVSYYAVTLASKGLRMNAVIPGTIVKEESRHYYEKNKELRELFAKNIPLGRMVTTQDIADLVAFLCSDQSSMITGQKMVLDGGMSLVGQESLLVKNQQTQEL